MKRTLFLAYLLTLFSVSSARAVSLELPIWRPTSPAAALPAYRADRVSLQLTPQAARAARARAVRGSARALGVSAIDGVLAELGATIRPEFRGETPPPPGSSAVDFTAFYLVDLPPDVELGQVMDRFASLPEVAKASPIGIATVAAVPNDSLWAGSWHLYQTSRRDVHALEAWDVTQGDTSVVVAIIDTGVIPYHPDIGGVTPGSRGQIWTNIVESRGLKGVDDDGNGYVDDVQGWDFVSLPFGGDYSPGEDWLYEDNDPNDYVGHGTTVAGILGAIGDNQIGITGTARKVRLMPLRVGWSTVPVPTGVVDMSYVAQAVRYATLNGARVINISLSTTALTELSAAVSAALEAGVSVVLAAGNNGSPNGIPDFPALIQVTATDRNDVIPPWANVGAYVDFTAPGAAIPATNLRRTGTDSLGLRQPGYVADANGTSFAAPIASGALALLHASRLKRGQALLDPDMMRLLLMASCDDISAANPGAPSVYYGAGRLNIAKALTASEGVRLARLSGGTVGTTIEFTRSNGARALASVTAGRRLVFLDAATMIPFRDIDLGFVVDHVAAADIGGGRGLGFFASLTNRRIVGIGGGGAALPGWPVVLPPSEARSSGPVLGDLDGDGYLDVVVVSYDSYGFETVWAWDQNGRLRTGFPVPLGRAVEFLPALGDLDGEPGLEIVVPDGDQFTHALRHDGRRLAGWPASTPGTAAASPVITRREGVPLVVVINRRNWYGIRFDGQMAIQRDLGGDLSVRDPVLVDLDQDGTDDVLMPATLALHAWYLGPSPTPSPSWPRSSFPTTFTESPLVGHLTGGAGPEILQTTPGRAVALNLDGTPIQGFPVQLPLARVTLISPVRGSRAALCSPYSTSGLISLDLDEGSWGTGPAPWPTARGNFARTGCRLGAPPMSLADAEPPAPIIDLQAATVSATKIRLTWHAPLDPGASGRAVVYDLRFSPSPISVDEFEQRVRVEGLPLPRAAGEAETLEVVVPAGSNRYYRLRALDGSGNQSPVSNQVAGGTPSQTPDPVSGLAVAGASASELTLRWNATGDDGWLGRPVRYEIAASPLSLNPVEFERTPFRSTREATVDAGAEESASIVDLPPDTHFWIAIRAVDDEGNFSVLSDLVEATTATVGEHVEDLLPPVAVGDLRGASVTLSTARLIWTAPDDDVALGRAVRYEVRWAVVPLTPPTFQAGILVPTPAWPKPTGAPETLWVQPPPSGRRYFSLRSFDAVGHASALSNAFELTAPSTPPSRVGDLQVLAAAETLVTLRWTGSGEDGSSGRATAYEIYADGSRFSEGNLDEVAYRFSVAATKTAGEPESTVIRGLPRWVHVWIGVRARDQFGVWSPLSNLVEAETANAGPGAGGFALELASNPCRAPIRFRWSTGDAGTQSRLTLHDVTGRRVRDLSLESGSFGFVVWDGADAEGRRMPAGLYFAMLSTPARRTVTRVVVLP